MTGVTGTAAQDMTDVTDMTDVIGVRLLGDVQVHVGGAALEALRSGRVRSLLAYLVLNPDVAHSRQRLAFAFWPDSSEGQARTNLRNVLHLLRRAHPSLAASVQVTPSTLQWRPVAPADVDVERFVTAVDAATAVDPDQADELIARCTAAADLYAGDLLADDEDEWVAARRADLRSRYLDVLRRLTTALIDAGRAREATLTADRLARAEPLDESAHRLRIEAHDRAGDRAGAVRAYHECVATLERELGVEPGASTVSLYQALLEGSPDAPSSPPRRSGRSRHRLVGREREWQRLIAAWESVERGAASLLLVSGEPGIGKTRLVDELRGWCAESAASVGVARSYAIEGSLGYAVLASWLRSPDVVRGRSCLAEDHLRELARLLPELGAAPPVDGADEATLRRRLFDVAVAALTASGRPTLLVADDAQWGDPASLEFVHYLIRQPLDVPLLMVATARSEDLDRAHPLTTLLDALAVLDRVTELRLERLPHEATGDLGSQILGRALDDDAVDALFEETDGNPLFIVETVRAGWDGQGAMALSPRLRAVIDARFRQLSDDAVAVVRTAAVVGRPCGATLLGIVSGLDERSLVQGIDELWQRGILCETGTDAYDFSHGKLREAAYDGLTPASRRALHGAVADALVQRAEGDGPPVPSEVAFHAEAANRIDLAVVWLQRAALDAQRTFDYREATRLLDRALAFVPQLPADVRHGRELELLSTLPGALAGVDGYGTARMNLAQQRAVDVAADLGVELEPAFERSIVMSALCRDEFPAAAAGAERLVARATATGNTALRIESHYLMGISAFWAADLDNARRHFEIVVEHFDPTTSRDHQLVYGHDPKVVCLSRLANTLWFIGRDDNARTACDEALTMATTVRHPLSHDTAVIFSSVLAVDLGDHDLLRRCAPHLGELGMDSVPHTTKREALMGLVDVLDGRDAQGIERVKAAFDRCDGRNFYPGFQATILRLLLAAHEIAGDATGGLATVDRALTLGSTPLWHAEAHRLRAEFLQMTGADGDVVVAALDEARAMARRQRAAGHLRRIQETQDRLLAT